MRRTASSGLGICAVLFSVLALMVGSPGLFYMSTAVGCMLGAARLQAWIATRGLRIERLAPSTVSVGDRVSVEVLVWSQLKIKRPLIALIDNLPKRMAAREVSLSLPIAPAFDLPVKSQFHFYAGRRGRFRWSGVLVRGVDAIGVALVTKMYPTEMTELTVWPKPIPFNVEIPSTGGFGTGEEGASQGRGGIEPRGVREYTFGDPLRYVHWASTARMNRLIVKEFEAGSTIVAGVFLQRSKGSDVGGAPESSLDRLTGYAAYLAEELGRHGAEVIFPQVEDPSTLKHAATRLNDVYNLLAELRADSDKSLGDDIIESIDDPRCGNHMFIFVSGWDPTLTSALLEMKKRRLGATIVVEDGAIFARNDFERKRAKPIGAQELEELERMGARICFAGDAFQTNERRRSA